MTIDKDNELLEFACKVCKMKSKAQQGNFEECGYRFFKNEYCSIIELALKECEQNDTNN